MADEEAESDSSDEEWGDANAATSTSPGPVTRSQNGIPPKKPNRYMA